MWTISLGKREEPPARDCEGPDSDEERKLFIELQGGEKREEMRTISRMCDDDVKNQQRHAKKQPHKSPRVGMSSALRENEA